MLTIIGSSLLTLDHDLHRQRRRVLDPFFSRNAVRKMEPLLASLLHRFENRLEAAKGTIIRLDHAFVAFSGDMIRSVTCEDIKYLMDDPQWSFAWFDLFKLVVTSAPLFTSFPWIIKAIRYVPLGALTCIFPRGQAFVDFKNIARNHIIEAKQERTKSEIQPSDSIFRKIAQLDLPESELDTERLTKEAQALFGAATVAVARTFDNIAYYALATPRIRTALTKELASLMENYPQRLPTLAELERLPYLQGVVLEGLRYDRSADMVNFLKLSYHRLSYGSMHRMPRVSPDVAIRYKQWSIPSGVSIFQGSIQTNADRSLDSSWHVGISEPH